MNDKYLCRTGWVIYAYSLLTTISELRLMGWSLYLQFSTQNIKTDFMSLLHSYYSC